MAKYAYTVPYGSDNKKIDAAKLPLHNNKKIYYCTTPGCCAKMHVRSPQKSSACFVSFHANDHTGGVLCHLKDQFKPDKYDEKLFSLENFFNNLFSHNSNDSSSLYGSGGKGTNQHIPVNTLRMLYLMCLQYRDDGSYNGYPIDEILIDKYDFNKYIASGITGNRIISCTFFRYDSNMQCIYMNCPDELFFSKAQHQLLKIHVPDQQMFNKCLNKLIDKTHSKLSVIAGNWVSSYDGNCIAECELFSIGKQICKGDQL